MGRLLCCLPFLHVCRVHLLSCVAVAMRWLNLEAPEEPSASNEDAVKTFSVTNTGVRYKDLKIGTGPEASDR